MDNNEVSLTYEAQGIERFKLNPSELISRLTVEHALYFLLAAMAFILRFYALGANLLSPQEATQALSLWEAWKPGAVGISYASPAYYTLTGLLTQIFGFNDAIVRLIPAIFSFCLVLLPWFLRQRNGRIGSIIVALFFALSPTQVIIGRTAGGQAIALFSGMLLFISWLRFKETSSHRWLYMSSLSLALGLTSDPLFYTLSLSLLLAWLVQHFLKPHLFSSEDSPQYIYLADKKVFSKAIFLFLGALFVLSTAILSNFRGIGYSIQLMTDWLASFNPSGIFNGIGTAIFALLRYEPLIFTIGIIAIIWAIRRRIAYPLFLVYWFLFSLLILFFSPENLANILVLTIPGYLLIGRFSNDVLERPLGLSKWIVAGIVLLGSTVIYFNLTRFARLSLFTPTSTQTYHTLLVFLAFAFMAAIIGSIWSWDSRAAKQGTLLGLLGISLFYSWSTAWWLSNDASNDTRELWVHAASDDDLRLLSEAVEEISYQVSRSAHNLQLYSTIENESLRWYLRDLIDIEFGQVLPNTISSQALLTSEDAAPELADNYIGADFGYFRPDTPLNFSVANYDALLRWILFHQSVSPVNEERLILWLRSDLAGVEQ